MAAQFIPVDQFDLVVFGGTGDLAMRKLLPGLYHRDCDDQLPKGSRIIALARSELAREEYQNNVHAALTEHVEAESLEPAAIQRFLERLHYIQLDALADQGWAELKALLESHDSLVRVCYLATKPDIFGPICRNLALNGLVTPQTRVVLEKPIGRDTESAAAINDEVGAVLEEHQIFRIDHYLGKETVQNLITLRFSNILFEPLWNSNAIDNVQITVSEELGVGDRADYYNTSGAMRDMVQNHILQLLCLVAMEPPSSWNPDAMRDEKLKVLRALRPITGREVKQKTVRGQYAAGAVNGTAVKGYLDELESAKQSDTETYVAIKAEVDNWRWAGVPFYLRTGKRMAMKHSEIVIQFKPVPHSIFGDATGQMVANRLVVRLQPDEGVKLFLTIKDPGPGGLRLKNVPLNLSYAETFTIRYPDAYERLLMDVIRGNPTLFMRKDEVEAAWHWVDPIINGWRELGLSPKNYNAGSWGPSDATALLVRDHRSWVEEAS